MSSPAADQIEGSLSSEGNLPPGSYPTTSLNIPNRESLYDKAPNEASVSSVQSAFDGSEVTSNDPSDIKVYATNTKTELDADHEEISHLEMSAIEISRDHKSAIEGHLLLGTPPKKVSPSPPSAEFSPEEGNASTITESNTPTSSENALSTFVEKETRVPDTVSVSGPVSQMAGVRAGAGEPKDKNWFDIFDSNDYDTSGNGGCRSSNSLDGPSSIDNGFISPRHYYASPYPNGHLATPAPKKIASVLTPPSSGEKSSVVSACSQEIALEDSPFEKEALPTLPHENHTSGVSTLEQSHLPILPHEEYQAGGVAPFEENDHCTLPQEEDSNGDVHTWEPNDPPPPPCENHYRDVTPFEENDYSIPPQGENHNGGVRALERNDLSPLPYGDRYGDVTPFEESGHSTPPQEEGHRDDVHTLERSDVSPLPHENCGGDSTPFQGNDHLAPPNEENLYGDVTPFEESDHSILPQEENHNGGVRTLERNDLSPLPHESQYDDVTPFQENGNFALHQGENHCLTLPNKENHRGDFPTPNKFSRNPYDVPKAINRKEKSSWRQPGGDFSRPSVTGSRTSSGYGDGYRYRDTEGSNHRSRSPGYHLKSSCHITQESSGRDRSGSLASDIKRGRPRGLSPSHRSTRGRNGPHSLSGSNASHQAEHRSIRRRFGTRTFKGDRYIPPPQPTRPARRSPAPSPGRELTPPRHIPRNRSRSRSPPPARPECRSSRYPEHTPGSTHPIRSSRALPDQSTAFQNSVRSLNTVSRHGAESVFPGGHSTDRRNSNYLDTRIPTSSRRPGKRRRHEDEPPAQHKRSRRDEQFYNHGNMRDYKAPRSYGSR